MLVCLPARTEVALCATGPERQWPGAPQGPTGRPADWPGTFRRRFQAILPAPARSTGTGFDFDLGSTSGRDEKRVALTRSTHPFWMVLTLVFGFSDVFVLDQALAGALHLGLGGSPV